MGRLPPASGELRPMSTLALHPLVPKVDLPALPPQFQMLAVRHLLGLRDRRSEYVPVELHKTHVGLDLTGCLALRFGGEAYEDSFRIVYRQEGDDVYILAVGPRMGSAVYRTAQDRLRPPSEPVAVRPMRTWRMDHAPQARLRRA